MAPFCGPLSLVWLCLFPLATAARAQEDERSTTPPGREGSLSNDCFLPSSILALGDLGAGDRLLLRAREAQQREQAAAARRLLGNAFERWHDATAHAARGSSVYTETSTVAVRRVTEGLGYALRRRLNALDRNEQRAWVERFAPSARTALDEILQRGSSESELLELQWSHAGTPAAAQAAVLACDRALEAGQQTLARAYIARGRWHAAFSEYEPGVDALRKRKLALGPRPEAESTASPQEAWTRASGLKFADAIVLSPGRGLSEERHGPGMGVRPGLSFVDEHTLVVQTIGHIHLLRIGKDGDLERIRFFEPDKLLGGFTPWLDQRLIRPEPPGWALSPDTRGETLVFVHGRTLGDGDRNALFCVNLPDPETVQRRSMKASPPLPSLSWAIVGDLHVDHRGEVSEIEELAALPRLEFQPGPAILGEHVYAMARASEGDVRAWLLAFRKADGALIWKRLLAKGADVQPDGGRLRAAASGLYGGASQELLIVDAGNEVRLFCGTHLGAGILVDALDGTPVWSVKGRRRDARERGWSGAAPVTGPAGAILWAPADSDRLYSLIDGPLRVDPGASGRDVDALFRAPVRPLGEAVAFLGGDSETSFVLGRARAQKTVSRRRPGQDRIEGLYLAPEETFAGEGLLGETRILFSTTRGLYLFDRLRELYLLDYQRIPRIGEAPAGGDVYARGRTVLVLGRRVLWAFQVEP